MKKVLAFDLSSNVGWAFTDNAAGFSRTTVVFGSENFAKARGESMGMRYLRFRSWLEVMGEQCKPLDLVAYELVTGNRSHRASIIYGAFQSQLLTWCEQQGIQYMGLLPADIKRHATGKGNANKVAMIAAAEALGYHLEPDDDDEADALHLLEFVVEKYAKIDSKALSLAGGAPTAE